MKSVQEVSAEVKRRSKQRIIAKKRRNRVMISVVSTAACVVLVLGALILHPWDFISDDRAMDNAHIENIEGVEVQSTTEHTDKTDDNDQLVKYLYVSLEVKRSPFADESAEALSDLERIAYIADTLKDFFANDDIVSDLASSDGRQPIKATEYKIIFKTFDGEEVVYVLSGNTLSGGEFGLSVTLTPTQLQELKAMLVI